MNADREGVEAVAGTRVQIRFQVLPPGGRAANVPLDTSTVPYEVRVKGTLSEPARLGDEATIVTPTGRSLQGRLETIDPADTHSFGRPPKALVEAQEAIRTLLHGGSDG